MSFTAAIYGLGNIGQNAIAALEITPDVKCLGVVRRPTSLGKKVFNLRGVPEFPNFTELEKHAGKPDIVLICAPSRNVPQVASDLLSQGYCTVDSFDIHEEICTTVEMLDLKAKAHKGVSITAAGWDPGTDSILRAMFEAMAPIGTTYTNFGRGRSMGHSVAARAIKGIVDATSITIPIGGGRHARQLYIVLEDGADFATVKAAIQADPYFSHDPLDVKAVSADELHFVADASHGVQMERLGASGFADNQRLHFDMRINNPALTAQIMVAYARAAVRLAQKGEFGCYTTLDVAPVLLLPGDRMSNLGRLV